MDTIWVRNCLWPSAFGCPPCFQDYLQGCIGLHWDTRCKHTWTEVTSSGGIPSEQLVKTQRRGWGQETRIWTILNPVKDKVSKSTLHATNKDVISCLRVSLSTHNIKNRNSRSGIKPREGHITAERLSSTQRRRHHSSAHITGVVCPRPSCRCLCCVLSLQAELATVCVSDRYQETRGGRLWYFSSCFLYAAAPLQTGHFKSSSALPPLCVRGSPKGSSARRCSETQQRVEGHPTSITLDTISSEETQVCCAGRVDREAYWHRCFHISRIKANAFQKRLFCHIFNSICTHFLFNWQK